MVANDPTTPPELSFGIELEFLLIFHEDELLSILRARNPAASLEKGLDPQGDIAKALRHRGYESIDHRSWAIVNDGECSDSLNPSIRICKDGQDLAIRCYNREALELTQQILSNVDGFQSVATYFAPSYGKHSDYSQWTICSDPSLQGLSSEQLIRQLGGRISQNSEALDWDSWGVEIISPVLRLSDMEHLCPTINNLLESLKGTPETKYEVAVTETCGLHVHVGFHDDSNFPLATIQYFALLIAVYEHEILRLCQATRCRPVGNEDRYLFSNRENLLWDVTDAPLDRPFVDAVTGEKFQQSEFEFKPVQGIKDILISNLNTDSYDRAVECVVNAMGRQRIKMVNFSYLLKRGVRPQTIEFRQHEGTTDQVVVCWWIQFCCGLVELAARMGRGEATFRVNSWDDTIWYQELLEDMDFPAEGRKYFFDKLNRQGDDGAARDIASLFSYVEHIPYNS
jgi:hypothetical protein